MQPYTDEFAQAQLTPQADDAAIGRSRFRAEVGKGEGRVIETGPDGRKSYPIAQVLGGKNVYYFLTPFERGRLQTLPLAYDVAKKAWFDTAASGVRHFPGGEASGRVDWKESAYTFNTACYSCHVSQLSSNYDLAADSYATTWAEPGINCETCHGPSAEHNRVLLETPKGEQPKDMKIISWKHFTTEQKNAACSICHAKMSPITATFVPGDRFFDHFDLATLEDPDFYPDGRDLGENYTYTSWLMSPCVKSGRLHCVHCHTSSGRYRFKAADKANQACLPCHQDKVNEAPAHTHHQPESSGSLCVSCHMPATTFARMNRTDHSLLPPTPAATVAYQSPNACNLCHQDKDAAWADKFVREWRSRDYQAPVLHRAGLIEAARRRDWSRLSAMLDYIADKDHDVVFATALIRMVPAANDQRSVPVLIEAARAPSPLMRAAAVEALQGANSKETVQTLLQAAGDDYRLVRVRAAASLAGREDQAWSDAQKKTIEAARQEYLASLLSRPDQWESHYNLGNDCLGRGRIEDAVASYDKALQMEPRALPALVNKAIAHARLGNNQKTGEALRKALEIAPENAAVNFNLGLLKAEENDPKGAETHLRAALQADSRMAQAAYNLSLLIAKENLDEAVDFCRQAAEQRPDLPSYAYTLAFFQQQRGDNVEAEAVLHALIAKHPGYADAYLLLGGVIEKQGAKDRAREVYRAGLAVEGMPANAKLAMQSRLAALAPGSAEEKK